MERELQRELDAVIKKAKGLPAKIQREVQSDLNEAAKIIVSAIKGDAPVSLRPHNVRGKLVRPGNLRKSIRRLPLRRARRAAIVGPSYQVTNNGFYAKFVEFGTRMQRAQRFIEKGAQRSRPAARRIAIGLISRRIDSLNPFK